MSFFDRFKKKLERTPGGSEIIRSRPRKPQDMLGFPERDTTPYAELRERIYAQLFGPYATVSHEIIPQVPHIDVYIHPPTTTRPFYTLISGGMSDLQMQLPSGVDHALARREIVLYCDSPTDEYINMVRYFARFPFQYATWLGHGHTVPNGDPPTPIFDNSSLVAIVLLYTILNPDNQLSEHIVIEDDPVQLLWLVPITQPELDYKLEYGISALLDRFDQVWHPVIVQPTRASYI